MKVEGKRALESAAVALALAVSLTGCAAEEAPDEPGAGAATATVAPSDGPAPTSPKPSKPSKQAPKGPPKAGMVKAFRKMQAAFEDEDAGAVLRGTGRLSKTYLKKTMRAVEAAGRERVQELSVWQKLVLITLRTDLAEDEIAALSTKEFLDYVFEYGLDYFPTAGLRKRAIEMASPGEGAAHIGRSMIWFAHVDGEWKVEVLGPFETMGLLTKEFAKKEGLTVKKAILGLAEEFTEDVVPGDVWSKP